MWADDLQLLVDGKPVWEAPKVERPKTPLDLDHEFDTGSGIVISKLTPAQIENLAMLGKVWGFLKYHHPAVATGTRHWDYDLLRVLPAVLAARDREAGDSVVLRDWIAPAGDAAAVRSVHRACRTRTCTCVQTWLGSTRTRQWGASWPGCCARSTASRLGGKQFYRVASRRASAIQ